MLPTKANLIACKKNLAMSKTGFELLDRKRNVLMREMMRLIDESAALQKDIGNTFTNAYSALQTANITLGIESTLQNYMPTENGVSITTRNVMGVNIAKVNLNPSPVYPFYGFSTTNAYLDEAYLSFDSVKKLCARLAGTENNVYRLAIAIKTIKRRANVLENVMIPRYEASIKFISGVLEEHDREEFVRMKVIKQAQQKSK